MLLETQFPTYYSSKYSLVTFSESIGYAEALKRGRAQDKAILNLLSDGKISTEDTPGSLLKIVKSETQAILHDDDVVGSL